MTFGFHLVLGRSGAKTMAATGRWWIVIRPVDPLQRAVGRPGPQQGSIDREVFRAQQRLDLWRLQQELLKLGHELLIQQPITVLGVDEVGRRTYLDECHTASSGFSPVNQRMSRLVSSCSMNIRSERCRRPPAATGPRATAQEVSRACHPRGTA